MAYATGDPTGTMRDLLIAWKCRPNERPIDVLAARRGHDSPVARRNVDAFRARVNVALAIREHRDGERRPVRVLPP